MTECVIFQVQSVSFIFLTLSSLSLSLSFLSSLTWHFPNEENFTPPDHDTNLIIASISIFLMTFPTKIINWRLWEKVQEKKVMIVSRETRETIYWMEWETEKMIPIHLNTVVETTIPNDILNGN